MGASVSMLDPILKDSAAHFEYKLQRCPERTAYVCLGLDDDINHVRKVP